MELTSFLPLSRLITHDRRDAVWLALTGVTQHCDGERDRKAPTITVQCWHLQQAIAVVGVTGCHHAAVAVPVSNSLTLGDDEVERLAHRLWRRPAEEPLGGVVPEDDSSAAASAPSESWPRRTDRRWW